jgi:hypothetical protein
MIARWPWAGAMAALGVGLLVRAGGAASVEPSLVPTVHPTLLPSSAIAAPLRLAAGHTTVWRSNQEQQMLLTGGVTISLGYRQLKADAAAAWLTPVRESGAAIYDVAIYLSGDVEVREGADAGATVTTGKELLVTTKVSQEVQLQGTLETRNDEDAPVFQRGKALRDEVLARRPAPLHSAVMTITTPEQALQSGWISRGPNNRLIPGPGDLRVERDAQGNVQVVPTTQGAVKPAKPRPDVVALPDPGSRFRAEQVGHEMAYVIPGVYMLFDAHDGKPPMEFRAQRMVAFGPLTEESTATASAPATTPASQPAGATTGEQAGEPEFLRQVTGVYLEGDVTLDQGDQIMVRAERVYYDLTSNRAIMLDSTLATVDTARRLPVYMRAAEIRQWARGEFAAKDVTFSTSEFFTPHYSIGAGQAYMKDISSATAAPAVATVAGTGIGLGENGLAASKDWEFTVTDATIDMQGMPIFWWPYLAGDTSQMDIPVRTLRVANSRNYGLSLLMDWDLFGLTGIQAPPGLRGDLNIDYFGKRGLAGGIQSEWDTPEDRGSLRSYALLDGGSDWMGWARGKVLPTQDARGLVAGREQHDIGDGWKLQIEGTFVTDPTFTEAFFQHDFDVAPEHETSFYLKHQGQTDDLTFLAKYNLMDFTLTADQEDEQFTTNKLPEVKYWRIGDSLLDLFTYYSESSFANVQMDITNYTPARLGLDGDFLGLPARVPPPGQMPPDQTYRAYLRSLGWTTNTIARGDTRQELDLPLRVGDAKITPYVAGRLTWWDTDFAEDTGGSTTRLWGGGGVRSAMQFWKVYDDVESLFFDVHRLRHVVEPQFNLYAGATDVQRGELQPFDRDVEGITGASGYQLALNQKWQTKRGPEGQQHDVDWIVLNISWNKFWNQDKTDPGTLFFPMAPARGYFFMSRPDLSLATNSINVDWTWRIGERVRLLGDLNYSLDTGTLEQAAAGLAVDQAENLSYFVGTRYIGPLNTEEWTFGLDYQITKKYELMLAESFDTRSGTNILTSFSLLRRLPRFIAAITVTYDANNADTTVLFTAWPEGFPDAGFGTRTGSRTDQR